MKKYEITEEGHPEIAELRRIRALIDIPGTAVKAGQLGGWIENESNLSQYGTCWVHDKACVYGSANVEGNAHVVSSAHVFNQARVVDNALVSGFARVSGYSCIAGNASVFGTAQVSGGAIVYGHANVFSDARVSGRSLVEGSARISENARISNTKDYMVFSGLGSTGRHCTLFRTEDGHCMEAGCWHGTVEQFEQRVLKAYGPDSDYMQVIPLLRFKVDSWNNEEIHTKKSR